LLIPGLLRCIDANFLRFLDSASPYSVIFIVTEKSFSKEVAFLVDRYDAKAWYLEDLAAKYPNHLASLFTGAFAQWLKFDYALKQALEWEEANRVKFEFIHRIRSDVAFSDNFYELFVLGLNDQDRSYPCMLNVHDFCFSARRDALPALTDLLSFFYNYRYDKATFARVHKNVNVDQLSQSEIHSACYLSAFPIGVAVENQPSDELGLLLKEKYPSYPSTSSFIEAAVAFASSLSDPQNMSNFLSLTRNKSFLLHSWKLGRYKHCYPENILARYYNFFGIRTYKYNSRITLKQTRHATTDFTSNIFKMIDDNNILFLSNDKIDWVSEISDFVDNGGRLRKLCLIFVGLIKASPSFKRSECEALKVIFATIAFKSSSDLSDFFPKAIRELAFKKGIELPDAWTG
jgi:hypothetical protein